MGIENKGKKHINGVRKLVTLLSREAQLDRGSRNGVLDTRVDEWHHTRRRSISQLVFTRQPPGASFVSEKDDESSGKTTQSLDPKHPLHL